MQIKTLLTRMVLTMSMVRHFHICHDRTSQKKQWMTVITAWKRCQEWYCLSPVFLLLTQNMMLVLISHYKQIQLTISTITVPSSENLFAGCISLGLLNHVIKRSYFIYQLWGHNMFHKLITCLLQFPTWWFIFNNMLFFC